ncbi:hypothetical protein JEQ12_001961 [Ovis aries]|uniref:Uncharacterized protein n=1 Tax=Ovis aries TaxID=9940 RepID=A0A836AI38_SHEEP|nr:hypothetical protein JEQ12_001961 [Ovis aries]
MRQKKRNGSLPDCPPPEDPAIAQLLKKLLSQLKSSIRKSSLPSRKHVKQDSNVSEEWKSMFGSLEPPSMQQALPKGSDQAVMPAGKPPRSESSAAICVPLSTSPQVPELTNVQNKKPTVQVFSGTILPSTSQIQITTCKAELQRLIQQKREQCCAERIAKQMMGNAEWESKPPPPEFYAKRT